MTYLGISYSGPDKFLRDLVNKHIHWLKGDRLPVFLVTLIVLYDSNTAREFAKKCKEASDDEM